MFYGSVINKILENPELMKSLIKSGVIKTMSNYKLKIIHILGKKEESSISQIMRDVDISYKEAYRHVQELKEAGLILTEKKIKEKNMPVMVSLSVKGKELYNLMEDK